MLVNLYKTKTPLALFGLPIMIGLMALVVFFTPAQIHTATFVWQTKLVNQLQANSFVHYVATFFIVYLSAIRLNDVVNLFGFYSKNTYLPGFIYTLALLSFDQFSFNMLTLGYGLVIYGLAFLFRINRQDPAQNAVFLSSLLFGAATICHFLLFPVLLLPWFTLVIFRSFKWREWFMMILGASIPWLYHYGLHFFLTETTKVELEGLTLVSADIIWTLPTILHYSFLGLLAVFGCWRYFSLASSQLLVFKKRSRVLFHALWLSAITYGMGYLIYDIRIVSIIIPLAIVFGVQILYINRSLLFNTILYIWLALIIIKILF